MKLSDLLNDGYEIINIKFISTQTNVQFKISKKMGDLKNKKMTFLKKNETLIIIIDPIIE